MRIVIDAGHGGHDHGGRSLATAEKRTALDAAVLLWKELADLGHVTLPTRVSDVFVPLSQRAGYANTHNAELFVSLHANAGTSGARGPWTIYSAGSVAGQRLAEMIQSRLARAADVGNPRAFYPDASNWVGDRRLAVLRQTRMPAVIVELGFMTHPAEALRLADSSYLQRLVRAVAEGVQQYAPRG